MMNHNQTLTLVTKTRTYNAEVRIQISGDMVVARGSDEHGNRTCEECLELNMFMAIDGAGEEQKVQQFLLNVLAVMTNSDGPYAEHKMSGLRDALHHLAVLSRTSEEWRYMA